MSRTRLRPMPPMECLLFFEAAARKGSFKKAAEELCVTTAAVAYRIKTLEAYFDRPLFVRHSRGVRCLAEMGAKIALNRGRNPCPTIT